MHKLIKLNLKYLNEKNNDIKKIIDIKRKTIKSTC